MALIRKKGYRFTFNSDACKLCKGRCCTGSSGYIWSTEEELMQLAKEQNLRVEDFKQRYAYRVGERWSLREKALSKDNFACIFFDVPSNSCSVYHNRPEQCRTFPFWPEFQRRPQEAHDECPGVYLDSKN